MKTEFDYCRPTVGSFCVECCRGRRCANLAMLPDGTTGCPGHNGELIIEGAFPQLENCKRMFCLNGYRVNGRKLDTPEMLHQIQIEISR